MKHHLLSLLLYLLCGIMILPRLSLCQDTIAPLVECQSKTFNIPGDYRCIEPKDLIINYSDNQDKNEDLIIQFSQKNNGESWCINCDTFYWYGASKIIRDVGIEVTDLSGNASICRTNFIVTDSMDFCGQYESYIRGNVENALTHDPIRNAEFIISSPLGSQSTLTDENGNYFSSFDRRYTGWYFVRKSNGDHLTGVSLKDVIAIYRHLLGIKSFNSGIERIAADVNNDQRITIQDVSALLHLIRGSHPDFSSYREQKPWRFILRDENYRSDINPWPLKETDTTMFSSNYNGHFYGIKIGDVTGDARTFQSKTTKTRSGHSIQCSLNHLPNKNNHTKSCDIKIDHTIELAGFQLMLRIKGAKEIHPIKSNLIGIDDQCTIYKKEDDFILKLIWHDPSGKSKSFERGNSLFTIDYDPLNHQKTELHILNLEGCLGSEAYSPDLETYDIHWKNQIEDRTYENAELSITPNPWTQNSTLTFNTKSSGIGHISVYNFDGKSYLHPTEVVIAEGMNHFTLDKNIVNQPGTYLIKLSMNGRSFYTQMLLL